MASTKRADSNGNSSNNCVLGKRKKAQHKKGSYLSKWLDKTMQHLQEATPSMDPNIAIGNPNINWPLNYQFTPGLDPYRFNLYGCTPEPMSLPTLPTYYNPATFAPIPAEYRFCQRENKSIQVQRPRQRRRSENKAEEIHSTPLPTPNATFKMMQKTFSDSQDFSSLPPIVTSVGDTTSNSDLNNDKDESSNNNRCFSDPCVQDLPDVAQGANGDVESDSDSSEAGSKVGARLFSCLLDQITALKLSNEKLGKELLETKAELNNVRHQNTLWQKGSLASLGGSPNQSQLNNNGLLNTGYPPGVVTDVVREIRDAARLREEAVYSRLRTMLHERQDNGLSDIKLSDRSLEDIKNSLRASEVDKRMMLQRINKLENELRTMRISSGLDTSSNGDCHGNGGNGGEESDAELMRLRKEVVELRRAKTQSEEKAHKLEVLVTQLGSKFKSPPPTIGPESLPSDPEHDTNGRIRRTSINSSNSTVVFGPVTDL